MDKSLKQAFTSQPMSLKKRLQILQDFLILTSPKNIYIYTFHINSKVFLLPPKIKEARTWEIAKF